MMVNHCPEIDGIQFLTPKEIFRLIFNSVWDRGCGGAIRRVYFCFARFAISAAEGNELGAAIERPAPAQKNESHTQKRSQRTTNSIVERNTLHDPDCQTTKHYTISFAGSLGRTFAVPPTDLIMQILLPYAGVNLRGIVTISTIFPFCYVSDAASLTVRFLPLCGGEANRFAQGSAAGFDFVAVQGEAAAVLRGRAVIDGLVAIFAEPVEYFGVREIKGGSDSALSMMTAPSSSTVRPHFPSRVLLFSLHVCPFKPGQIPRQARPGDFFAPFPS